MSLHLLLLFFAGIAAFWLSAVCGGGASLILIPVLNMMLSPSHVPFALTVGTFTSSGARITVFRQHIRWEIVLWFVPFSIPAVWVGAWLIRFMNPFYLQFIVASFLIANLPQLFKSKKKILSEEKPYPKYVLSIVGFLAGFVSGITGAIGLLFNRFYLNYGMTKEQIIATRAANEIVLHFIKLVIYVVLGVYGVKAFYIGLWIAGASVLSAVTVKYILPYMGEFIFRKVGYWAMVLSGFLLFMGAGSNIFETDHISVIKKKTASEILINWKGNQFIVDYSFQDGFEIELPVRYEELPEHLKKTYRELSAIYTTILIEKTFKFLRPNTYEFYAYKNGALTKMRFQE